MKNYNLESCNAFVETFEINPYQSGSLDGLTFGVKDNIDIAGFKTSYGSKPWRNAHPPAVSYALCIEQLLGAGAKCIGKTISDEFTYSLDGESYFYGTPVNPKAPERIPGGSSSGSASAVACGIVDFAVGIADKEIQEALQESIYRLRKIKNIQISSVTFGDIMEEKLDLFFCNENVLRVLQSAEVWNSIGGWLEAVRPEMGPRIRFGLDDVKQTNRSTLNNVLCLREKIFTKVSQFMQSGDLFCFPTVPVIAPIKGDLDSMDKAMNFYIKTMAITSFSGAAHLPEISMPITQVENIPIGLSFAAGYRQDEFLLAAAKIFLDCPAS